VDPDQDIYAVSGDKAAIRPPLPPVNPAPTENADAEAPASLQIKPKKRDVNLTPSKESQSR
jgi:hypothetical protein